MIICEESNDIIFTNGAYPGVEVMRIRLADDVVVLGKTDALPNGFLSLNPYTGAVVGPQFAQGADIVVANTIAPTSYFHNLTGAGLIKTITPPAWVVAGSELAFLVKNGTVPTVDTTGNIGKVSTLIQNVTIYYTWDGQKFWPSY